MLTIEAANLVKVSTLVFQSIQGTPATVFFRSGLGNNTVNASTFHFFVDSAIKNFLISATGTSIRVNTISPNSEFTSFYSCMHGINVSFSILNFTEHIRASF